MTKMIMLSAAFILSAAIAAPALALAQGTGAAGSASRHGLKPKPGSISHHVRVHHRRDVRGTYMQPNDRYDPDPQFRRNRDNFGFSGRDPSRVGGEDPSTHPARK